jgi:hypothetical protein
MSAFSACFAVCVQGRDQRLRGVGNDEREQTLNQLLTELDGFSSDKDKAVICIAATNRCVCVCVCVCARAYVKESTLAATRSRASSGLLSSTAGGIISCVGPCNPQDCPLSEAGAWPLMCVADM